MCNKKRKVKDIIVGGAFFDYTHTRFLHFKHSNVLKNSYKMSFLVNDEFEIFGNVLPAAVNIWYIFQK